MTVCIDCRKQTRCGFIGTPNCGYFVKKLASKNDNKTEVEK